MRCNFGEVSVTYFVTLTESSGRSAGVVRQPVGGDEGEGSAVRGADGRTQRQAPGAEAGEGQRSRCSARYDCTLVTST